MLGWVAFGKVDNIMGSTKATMKIKRKIFSEHIMPVMTYCSKPWALNKTAVRTGGRPALDGANGMMIWSDEKPRLQSTVIQFQDTMNQVMPMFPT